MSSHVAAALFISVDLWLQEQNGSSSMRAEQVETETEVMDTVGAGIVEAENEMLHRLPQLETISMFSDTFLQRY